MGTAELTVERFDEPDYMHEELVVEIALDDQFKSSELGWAATTRVLIAINPPETGWDAAGDIYSTLSEIGDTEARVFQLQASCDLGELAQSRTNENRALLPPRQPLRRDHQRQRRPLTLRRLLRTYPRPPGPPGLRNVRAALQPTAVTSDKPPSAGSVSRTIDRLR
jgi:hypothetical protein